MKRYIVTKDVSLITTIVYKVREAGHPEWDTVAVWYEPNVQRVYCTKCSSALAAMSQSCAHARAVKRRLK